MPTGTLLHVTSVEERPSRRASLLRPVRAVCSCGWFAPTRLELVTAADDAAGHLLDVTR